ncbi:hypothetical protein H5410_036712 [Solanum commersonii]|uniref:Uncharacterized protein n=1 Tax=Solanum commersonii TaxID=4109 RepID=A0A9J5Y7C3_SOLCO|nr:hypothetical protein H5410_036712 [Solanum commersonii]
MKGKKAKEQREEMKEFEHRIHMVKAPSVLDKEPLRCLPRSRFHKSSQRKIAWRNEYFASYILYSQTKNTKSVHAYFCAGLNKIKIMSLVLETLSLIDLDDALVVNPNLRWFKIFDSFIFQNSCALVCSKLMVVEIGLKNNHAIISFHDMLPLETDTT